MLNSIAIDFGTMNSRCGFLNKNIFQIIEHSSQRKLTNYVGFKDNKFEIGDSLKSRIGMNFNKIAYDLKLFMGCEYAQNTIYQSKLVYEKNQLVLKIVLLEYSESFELENVKKSFENFNHLLRNISISIPSSFNENQIQKIIKEAEKAGFININFTNNESDYALNKYPFGIVCDEKRKAMFKIDSLEKEIYPEKLAAIVLDKIKETSEKKFGNKITNVVISVPSSFNDSQRQSTIDAAEIAGFKHISLIDDNSAAALAYAYDKNIENTKNIFVFNLGAHFLNISIANIKNYVIDVKYSASYPELGGQIMDYKIFEYLIEKYENELKSVYNNKKVIQRLLIECEKAKINLSNCLETNHENISLSSTDEDFSFKLSREKFEELNSGLFKNICELIENFLKENHVNLSEIDEILLIGGCSLIPIIQTNLKSFFKGKELNQTMNTSESVAYGCAIYAECLSNERFNCKYKLKNYSFYDYLLQIEDNEELNIKKSDILPLEQRLTIKKIINNSIGLKLIENEKIIFEQILEIFNSNKICINLFIDENKLVNISYQNKENLNNNKLNCLNLDKKKS